MRVVGYVEKINEDGESDFIAVDNPLTTRENDDTVVDDDDDQGWSDNDVEKRRKMQFQQPCGRP